MGGWGALAQLTSLIGQVGLDPAWLEGEVRENGASSLYEVGGPDDLQRHIETNWGRFISDAGPPTSQRLEAICSRAPPSHQAGSKPA